MLATFAASSYASWYGRAQKPFASTLGETYDWTSPDKRVRVVCECVVYDPPVAAFHAFGTTPRGTPFLVHGEGMGTSKFYGRYVQVNVKGGLHLELPRTRERYSWSKAAMHVHNVISGRVWVDMVGEVNVQAHPVFETDPSTGATGPSATRGGERASFRLKKGSKPNPGKPDARGALEGNVFDRHGVQTATLTGNCLDTLWICTDETYTGDAPVRLKKVLRRRPSPRHTRFATPRRRRRRRPYAVWKTAVRMTRATREPIRRLRRLNTWRGGSGGLAPTPLASTGSRRRHRAERAHAGGHAQPAPDGFAVPPRHARAGKRRFRRGEPRESAGGGPQPRARARAAQKGETYAPAWFARRAQSSPNDVEVHDEGNASSLSRIPEEPLATSPGRGSSPGDVSSPGSSQKSGVALRKNGKSAGAVREAREHFGEPHEPVGVPRGVLGAARDGRVCRARGGDG